MATGLTIFLILAIAIYFLKKSKSDFFARNREELADDRHKVVKLLYIKGRNNNDVEKYLEAYDFFCRFTTKFDGATIVKDLYDIPRLDLDAMVHDYECLTGANRNFVKWFQAAWNYFENMRKNGKGNQISRFILLIIVGFIFIPYCYLLTPKYYPLTK